MSAIESSHTFENKPGVGFKSFPGHIKITKFTPDHVGQAMQLARASYDLERVKNPNLPAVDQVPGLAYFTQNGYGSAAFTGDQMVGFMCFYPPIKDAFRTTNVKGTFSPIHAHAVTGENRERVLFLPL